MSTFGMVDVEDSGEYAMSILLVSSDSSLRKEASDNPSEQENSIWLDIASLLLNPETAIRSFLSLYHRIQSFP